MSATRCALGSEARSIMRRERLGVGAELVPLVLILACMAGTLGLIIATYHRAHVARTTPPRSSVVLAEPAPVPPPRPAPVVEETRRAAKTPRPKPVPTAPPEDPTPKVLAQLASAEAEQLLEASKANRKAQALEEARQAAMAESERWRRRQSLIHSQLDGLEGKVRKAETDIDALAFERDALEKEVDARKAAAARSKSRPSQAILPHKGPNGTWRRPIVVECRNGAAVIQPQGLEFGLFDLETGFGTLSNPFVRAVATEAVRIQRKNSPDGAPVVPYIFFLVRPDGIRPYYEARGRLEPLGITFGYELADQDWEVELPNLDDTSTWDGSEPASGANPTIARANPASSAEDTDLTAWPGSGGNGTGPGNNPAGPFTFGGGGSPSGGSTGSGSGGKFPWSSPPVGPSSPIVGAGSAFRGMAGGGSLGNDGAANLRPNPDDTPPEGFPTAFLAAGTATTDGSPALGGDGSKRTDSAGATSPGQNLGRVDASGRIVAGTPNGRGSSPFDPGTTRSATSGRVAGKGDDSARLSGSVSGSKLGGSTPPIELALEGPTADSVATSPPARDAAKPDDADPASTFLWPAGRDKNNQQPSATTPEGLPMSLPTSEADDAGAAQGTKTNDDSAPPGVGGAASTRPSSPASGGGRQAAKRTIGQASSAGQPSSGSANPPPTPGASGIGLNAPAIPSLPLATDMPPPSAQPPPSVASIPPLPMNLPIPAHLPTAAEAGAAVRRQTSPSPIDWSPTTSIVDRTFEVVVVCGPNGVVVQPGNYRVTADALQDRDGLFKKQVVALVKNRRAADPTTKVEPRIRFLVQPHGFETYRTARSQFFVSGLNWPTTTQVADPDPLAISPGGVW